MNVPLANSSHLSQSPSRSPPPPLPRRAVPRPTARPSRRRPAPTSLRALRTLAAVVTATAVLAGCATRPVNPPIEHFDAGKPYRVERTSANAEDNATLVILAFSGGGTRAAAFSYGVLETLRDIQVTTKSGRRVRVLDTVDVITGISGGSFTALAFGLYGDKLFEVYETSFLKRNVQGELVTRALSAMSVAVLSLWLDHCLERRAQRDFAREPGRIEDRAAERPHALV